MISIVTCVFITVTHFALKLAKFAISIAVWLFAYFTTWITFVNIHEPSFLSIVLTGILFWFAPTFSSHMRYTGIHCLTYIVYYLQLLSLLALFVFYYRVVLVVHHMQLLCF